MLRSGLVGGATNQANYDERKGSENLKFHEPIDLELASERAASGSGMQRGRILGLFSDWNGGA